MVSHINALQFRNPEAFKMSRGTAAPATTGNSKVSSFLRKVLYIHGKFRYIFIVLSYYCFFLGHYAKEN